MTFYGYRRPDGRVGVRNRVLILPASVCATDTARIIAQQVEGAISFNNQQGCSQVAPDQQFTMDVMAGYAANPNIYGTVVVSLGCENCQMDLVVKAIEERTNKPLKQVIIQEVGGTLKAVEIAVRYAKEMVAEASMLQKEEFPLSELIVGTECGGSDPTSGLAANPAIGAMSDLVVQAGGTSILSETSEFIGAEHILARRAINKEVHDRIYEITSRFEAHFHAVGEDVRQGNPSPGNKAGGMDFNVKVGIISYFYNFTAYFRERPHLPRKTRKGRAMLSLFSTAPQPATPGRSGYPVRRAGRAAGRRPSA